MSFDPNASEFGYIAIDAEHRGQQMSWRIVRELLANHQGMLVCNYIIRTHEEDPGGEWFVQKGRYWEGRRGQQLSVWIKEK